MQKPAPQTLPFRACMQATSCHPAAYINSPRTCAKSWARSQVDAKAMSKCKSAVQDAKGSLKRAFVGEEIKDGGRSTRRALVACLSISYSFSQPTLPGLARCQTSNCFPKEARPHYELGTPDHAATLLSNQAMGSDGDSLAVFVAEKPSCRLIRSEISQPNSATLSTRIQDLFPGLPSSSSNLIS